MGYLSEAPDWRRRRRRRQQATLAAIVVLVLGAGGLAYAYYSGMLADPDRAPVTTLPPCPTGAPALTPARVTANVYNATSRAGLAASTARALRSRSFTIAIVANDPVRAAVPGTALVRFGPKGKAAARLVAAQVTGARLVADKRTSAVVDLVLGERFTALRAVATPTKTLPAACATGTPRPGRPAPTVSGTPRRAVPTGTGR